VTRAERTGLGLLVFLFVLFVIWRLGA